MLDFHTPTLEDSKWITPLVEKSGQIGCDLSFATTYLWRKKYDIRVCYHDSFYYKAYYDKNKLSGYAFPIGTGSVKSAVDNILADAEKRKVTPIIGMLDNTNAEILTRLYPDRFVIEPERDSADYIYTQKDLADLSGKKYHAKRSHISKFKRTYEDYCYKPLEESNYSHALEVAKRWQQENSTDDLSELEAIKEALDNFSELSLFGGVLYVNKKPVAMTIASRINSCVCDVNFEKAVDIPQAYAVINNEFAKSNPEFLRINREEDLGLEGLRKSKLSYNPEIILMKHTAKPKNDYLSEDNL